MQMRMCMCMCMRMCVYVIYIYMYVYIYIYTYVCACVRCVGHIRPIERFQDITGPVGLATSAMLVLPEAQTVAAS